MVEIQTLNAVNILILHKPNFVTLKKNKTRLKLLKKLMDLNIVKSVTVKEKKVIIEANKNYNTKIQIVYKITKRKIVKLKIVKKLKNDYILRTHLGLLTSVEAAKHNIGGVLLAKI